MAKNRQIYPKWRQNYTSEKLSADYRDNKKSGFDIDNISYNIGIPFLVAIFLLGLYNFLISTVFDLPSLTIDDNEYFTFKAFKVYTVVIVLTILIRIMWFIHDKKE